MSGFSALMMSGVSGNETVGDLKTYCGMLTFGIVAVSLDAMGIVAELLSTFDECCRAL